MMPTLPKYTGIQAMKVNIRQNEYDTDQIEVYSKDMKYLVCNIHIDMLYEVLKPEDITALNDGGSLQLLIINVAEED